MPFLLKKYSSFKKIADGGMSELFIANEISTNHSVVIKKMALPSAHRTLLLKRIENDLHRISSLSHDNIISIIDYGLNGKNFYTVMEHIDGCNLNTLICDNSFDRRVGLMIVFKALQALHFCHIKGIIHCDIKPSNILVNRAGRVVLSDFGLSQTVEVKNSYGDFITPLFMPPEQAYLVSGQNDLNKEVWAETASVFYNDPTPEQIRALNERGMQWDIWSVGVLMYRVCSGYYPFYDSDFAKLLSSIVHKEPMDILEIVPDLPNTVATVIKKCLQKEPYQRHQSLEPIINVLQEYFISLGASNIDELIAHYVRDKISEFSVTDDSDALNVTPSNESEWELNEYVDLLSAQSEELTKQDEQLGDQQTASEQEEIIELQEEIVSQQEVIVDQQEKLVKLSEPLVTASQIHELQNDTPIEQHESEWEFSEYKTLHYDPSAGKKGETKLFPEEARDSATQSLNNENNIPDENYLPSTFVSRYRSQLILLTVAFFAIVIIAVISLFVIKGVSGKQDKVARSKVSVIKEHNLPAKPNAAPSKPEVKPIQEALDIPAQQKAKAVLADTRIKNNVLPVQSVPVKSLQTQKRELMTNSSIANKSTKSTSVNLPGVLKIAIDPPDAQVYIDGSLLNQIEIMNGKKITPGNYSISARAAGYVSYRQSVQIESDKTLMLSVALKQDVKGNGQLHIYSYPWANLYIDGELVGTTPTPSPIVLVEGNHNVVLKRDGYQQHSELVTIRNGDIVRLQVQLKKVGE